MWSLISGLVVLLVMIIGACIGYVSAFRSRKNEENDFRLRVAQDQPGVLTNATSGTLSEQSVSSAPVTIIVSPRDLERITQEMRNPPAYEDLPLPPPYEIAITYE